MAQDCIWITGGSTGLGRALALKAAKASSRPVVVSARGPDGLAEVAEAAGGRIATYPLDATDRAATADVVARIEKEIAPIGLAVLNAGTHAETPAAALNANDFEAIMRLNYLGVVYGLEALLARMRARGGGHIAVTASVAGYRGLPRAAAYCASKAAAIALCESLKPELDADGIRLQVCNPGFVRTPLTDKNSFKMPYLMEPDAAAEAYWKGLNGSAFEISFPKPFVRQMKLLRLLPHGAFFAAMRKVTGVGT